MYRKVCRKRANCISDEISTETMGLHAMTSGMKRIISFVMSGGVGSRLWPLSREDFPKQFHNLSGQGSMLLRTVKRMGARGGEMPVPVYLLASERHADRISQDLSGVDLAGGRAILEPMGRNTAAAVVLATEITLREARLYALGADMARQA